MDWLDFVGICCFLPWSRDGSWKIHTTCYSRSSVRCLLQDSWVGSVFKAVTGIFFRAVELLNIQAVLRYEVSYLASLVTLEADDCLLVLNTVWCCYVWLTISLHVTSPAKEFFLWKQIFNHLWSLLHCIANNNDTIQKEHGVNVGSTWWITGAYSATDQV